MAICRINWRHSSAFVQRTVCTALATRSYWNHLPRYHGASGKRLLHNGTQAGIVTTTNVTETPIAELLESIKPLQEDSHDDSALLVLVTGSYAKHARDPSLPSKVLDHLYHGYKRQGCVHSITAVVDALPASGKDAQGIAFMLHTGTPSVIDQEPIRKAAQRAGTLGFDLDVSSGRSWRLQLPLSQTIFSTGLTSTLILRTYAANHAEPESEDYLESLTIGVQQPVAADELQIDYPLVQLTSYRTVQNSMGNIVRTLSHHDGERSKEEPASRNLEDAVAAYFTALSMAPEAVNVWALVIPRSIVAAGAVRHIVDGLVTTDEALSKLWSRSQTDGNTFRTLLQHKARLVKVLSGGGGWGKKAGLLSLDPDLEYSTRELREDYGWQFDFEQLDSDMSIERQLDHALGSAVEEGDGIVFFIAPKAASTDELSSNHAPVDSTFMFSVCKDSELTTVGADADKIITYRENVFGMSSETGMALQIREGGALVNKSKLEVPGLRVCCPCKD